MTPVDDKPPLHYDPPAARTCEEALYDVRNALTVARAYAQLLQRRARQGEPADASYVVHRLSIIEQMTRRMDTHLRELSGDHRAHKPDHG